MRIWILFLTPQRTQNGMVATSQHLAALSGLNILKMGSNTIDAAIPTAACLIVVEPTSNGIGGDTFALVWVKIMRLPGNGKKARRLIWSPDFQNIMQKH